MLYVDEMISIPGTFAARLRTPAQRHWLAALPELVERYRRRWDLRLDGEPMHGYSGLVVPVRTRYYIVRSRNKPIAGARNCLPRRRVWAMPYPPR